MPLAWWALWPLGTTWASPPRPPPPPSGVGGPSLCRSTCRSQAGALEEDRGCPPLRGPTGRAESLGVTGFQFDLPGAPLPPTLCPLRPAHNVQEQGQGGSLSLNPVHPRAAANTPTPPPAPPPLLPCPDSLLSEPPWETGTHPQKPWPPCALEKNQGGQRMPGKKGKTLNQTQNMLLPLWSPPGESGDSLPDAFLG